MGKSYKSNNEYSRKWANQRNSKKKLNNNNKKEKKHHDDDDDASYDRGSILISSDW